MSEHVVDWIPDHGGSAEEMEQEHACVNGWDCYVWRRSDGTGFDWVNLRDLEEVHAPHPERNRENARAEAVDKALNSQSDARKGQQ